LAAATEMEIKLESTLELDKDYNIQETDRADATP
jgi:hypothetical protein